MKYLIFFLILFTSCRTTTLTLYSEKFAYRTNQNDQWSEFSDWMPTNQKIKIKDPKFLCKNTILKIKGKKTHKYILFKDSIDSTRDENGNQSIRINAKDTDGSNLYLIFINKGDKVFMITYYTNLNTLYEVTD